MATKTVYSQLGDGHIYSGDTAGYPTTSYAAALAGTGDTFAALVNGDLKIGQYDTGSGDFIYQGYTSFDTTLPFGSTINSVTLSLYCTGDFSTSSEFTVEVYNQSWLSSGLTTADWVDPSGLVVGNRLANIATTALSVSAYNAFTSEAGMIAAINTSGNTEFVVTASTSRTSTAPTGLEWVRFYDGADASPPKLVIDYDTTGSTNNSIFLGTNF